MPQSQLVQLVMPDGQLMWATVEGRGGPRDSGIGEQVVERLEGFQQSLQTVAANVRTAVAAARPDEVSVEFGLELAAGKSGVIAAVAGVNGKAAFKVTLTWGAPGRSEPDDEPPAAGSLSHPPRAQ